MNKGIKTKYGKPLLEWEDLECYVKDLDKEIERLNNIIDKAIEYMNDTIDFSWKDNSPIKNGKSLSLNKLLDILKGSDKE